MAEIINRLRNHVRSRLPGTAPQIENGAWQMMLDAADRIEELEAEKQSIRTALMALLSTSKSVGMRVQVDITLDRDRYEIYSGLAWDHPTPFAELPPLEQLENGKGKDNG